MHVYIHYTQKKYGATKSLAGCVAPWRARLDLEVSPRRARARAGGGIFRRAKLTTSTLVFVFNLNLRPKTCNNQEVGERSRTTTCMHPIGGLLHASPACTCKIAQLANQYSNNNQLETDWIKSTGNTCIWFN
jgi:hypothetical protein